MGSGARASRTGLETGTEGLTSGEVNAYMLDVSARLVVESAKREAADLRALLRYLYLAGLLEADLGTAMPRSPPGGARPCPRPCARQRSTRSSPAATDQAGAAGGTEWSSC